MRIAKSGVLALGLAAAIYFVVPFSKGATFVVKMRESGAHFFFDPANVTINPGDTIQWTNTSSNPHDSTHFPESGPRLWNSPLLASSTANNTFSFTFNNPGTYPYVCQNHYYRGHSEDSGLVTVVTPNLPPNVGILSPTNGATFFAPANFAIEANASDSDGNIAQIEFFSGNASLGVLITTPYTNIVSALPVGIYPLTAVATDNQGARATSSVVNVTVLQPPNLAPSVSILGPTNEMTFFAPAGFTIEASALDSDGSIAQVEFFSANVSLGVSTMVPYTNLVSALPQGTYSFTAVATDNQGAKATSSVVNVTVLQAPNLPPAVAFLTPNNGATFFAPASFMIEVLALDRDGTIAQIEFFSSNASLGVVTSLPYTNFQSALPVGTYSFSAVATDNQGAKATSSVVNITVTKPPNRPPSIAILSPNNGTRFFAPASFDLEATALDSDGSVAQVEFYRNGARVAVAARQPYTNQIDSLAAGLYELTAVAIDDEGAKATSSVAHIYVFPAPTISNYVTRLPDGSFQIRIFGGNSGNTCIIEATDYLTGWAPVFTNTFPDTDCAFCPFIDYTESATNSDRRVYRSRVFP